MTFLQLQTKINDWLGVDTNRLPAQVCKDIINTAQRDLCRSYDHFVNYAEVTVSLTTGLNGLTISTALPNLSRLLFVWAHIPDTDSWAPLTHMQPEDFHHRFPVSPSGAPSVYTLETNSITFDATADKDYSLFFNGFFNLADMSADGDSNLMTLYYWEPLFYRSLVLCCEYMLDEQRAARYQALAAAAEQTMVIEQSRRDYGDTALIPVEAS